MTSPGETLVLPSQNAINDFLKIPKDFRKDEIRVNNTFGFTTFDRKQSEKASKLASEFMVIANQNPNNPISKVVEAAREYNKSKDPELVRSAMMIFVDHHPAARRIRQLIPLFTQRAPKNTVPKKLKFTMAPGRPITGSATAGEPGEREVGDDVEQLLNWWREDPNMNEHEEHLHTVYPTEGVPDPNDPRYDVERHAVGMPLVKPLENLETSIPESYDPNDDLIEEDNDAPFSARSANLKLGDIDDKIKVKNSEHAETHIKETTKAGKFYDGSPITADILDKTLESSVKDNNRQSYHGNVHKDGNAYIRDPSHASAAGNDPGVMFTPRTAAKDDIFNERQNALPPNDFSDSPPVKIRSSDVILTFKDKLPINHGPSQDEEALKFGIEKFGGKNFDSDLSGSEFVTRALGTKVKTKNWSLTEDSGKTTEIGYLYPREFYYFVRVENTSSKDQDVSIRIFLAPEDLANSRTHWIELDKFKSRLPAQSKTVICRNSDRSSVVRQPPQKTENELDDVTIPPGEKYDSTAGTYCDCGWLYPSLLPRGRKGDGTKFKLLVFISDWNLDRVPTLNRCGNLSLCGSERLSDKYPDSRPMGYPFDRPFRNGSYEQTFSGLNNATISDITIKWVDDFPETKVPVK